MENHAGQNFQFHAFLQEVAPYIIPFHHSLGEEKLSSGEVKHLLKSSWSLAGVGGECHLLGLLAAVRDAGCGAMPRL